MSQDNFPSYPGGASHPEGTNGYGAGYQYGATPTSAGNLVEGDGRVRVFDSIGFGFRQTFKSPAPWILTTLALTIILGSIFGFAAFQSWTSFLEDNPSLMTDDGYTDPNIGTPGGFIFLGVVFTIIFSIVQMLYVTAALRATDGEKVTFRSFTKNKNLVPALVFTFVVSVITGSLQLIPGIANFAALIGVLISPLYMLMYIFILDRGLGFGDAIREGFQAGSRNYLPLLGWTILWTIILAIAAILLGFGLLIAAPAHALSLAYVYRQASKGLYPES